MELPDKPAKIDPMKLTLIEGTDWYTNRKNKQAPRLQNVAKQYELRRFTLKAVANGLIKPSNAMSWSHPHLTMKPSGASSSSSSRGSLLTVAARRPYWMTVIECGSAKLL